MSKACDGVLTPDSPKHDMIIVFIILGAWLIPAMLMVFSLAVAARRPETHSETSSLDTPINLERTDVRQRWANYTSPFNEKAQADGT